MVFLYERSKGSPEEVSKNFSEYFSKVSENLVKESLLSLPELKGIIESKSIFWGGIKENFGSILEDPDAIGHLAWTVFKNHTGREASEDIKSLVYEGSKSPWAFTLLACVLYG